LNDINIAVNQTVTVINDGKTEESQYMIYISQCNW